MNSQKLKYYYAKNIFILKFNRRYTITLEIHESLTISTEYKQLTI